jgi:hypothetical protein
MPRLVTISIRFSESSYRELRYRARRRGRTLASLAREAVDAYLARRPERRAIAIGDDPADRMIGCLRGSSGDESTNHDRYLYG